MHIIVKLFPEITIKSTPVRKRFIKQLRDNLRKLLADVDKGINVQRDWEKIDIQSASNDAEHIAQVTQVLANTPGIAHFSLVHSFVLGSLEDIAQQTLSLWSAPLAGKTFCVRAKRHGEHSFDTMEVERYVGAVLLRESNAAGVKLKHPDIEVKLEIKHETLYVVQQQISGVGGFPIGTQEPVLSLLSGGFDSTVASYLCMRRGMHTHYCFFNLGGSEHELAVKELAFYLWDTFGRSHPVRIISVPFEGVVAEILEKVDNPYMGVVLKRMMLRAASKVAQQAKIPALITGESVGQVASQTLTNLAVIDEVTDTLVLRPLISMHKQEIIAIARDIGTEAFSAAIPEYCGVISIRPSTRAKRERVEAVEEQFDFAVLEQALASSEVSFVDKVVRATAHSSVDTVSVWESGYHIIDIRHPDERDLKPLHVENATILPIPFYTLSTRFSELEQQCQYLLYCEKGVMSQLHASHLKDAGFSNIGVYRP